MGGKRGSRGRPGLSGSIRKRGRGEGSSVLCGCLGRVTEFLHFQFLSPLESAPCIIASSFAPTILTGHPLPPWLSQAPKRSAQGPQGVALCVPTDTVGGLLLGRHDLTPPGSAHPAPGRIIVREEQAPAMLGSDPDGPPRQGQSLWRLCSCPGSPQAWPLCPTERLGSKAWWPRQV